jgi:hypothetical protein
VQDKRNRSKVESGGRMEIKERVRIRTTGTTKEMMRGPARGERERERGETRRAKEAEPGLAGGLLPRRD